MKLICEMQYAIKLWETIEEHFDDKTLKLQETLRN